MPLFQMSRCSNRTRSKSAEIMAFSPSNWAGRSRMIQTGPEQHTINIMLRSLRHVVSLSSAARLPGARRALAQAAYDWRDPLLLKESLTEDEKMISETAQQYCQKRLLPRVIGLLPKSLKCNNDLLTLSDAYRNESYDPDILREMGELGLLGATIEGYGCPGVSDVASGVSLNSIKQMKRTMLR